ncbi:YtxH-like protein [Candidatus Methylomirabilis lanthanidiphila]|uniref:YtxH-like protein n=1 Tax=Candidatus Methylomirabilis lanthanidiphila TaxID=2211376 RepID=A0A564ZMT9_9BACT|nr:YtxH domain-containing protein [Candidatus Methylomirabilis lanthanidiphila]VUZ86406.1 YtxH-like protein [Candidatus Methylomirabilis lanthanidiphila]
MSEERGCSPASVALAFIVGGALGASLALLFAPEGGRQTRTRLKGFATDVKDRSTDLVEDVKDRVEDAIGVGKEMFEEKKAILTAAYQAGKEAMDRERGELLER